MDSKKVYFTDNASQTISLGEKTADQIRNGGVIAFYGNLGSGKTTFVQGLAKGLSIKQRILSPTFIIVRSYTLYSNNFYHVDLYRIENSNNLSSIGLIEIFENKKNIIALEWADKIKDILPKKRIDIFIKNLDQNKREITILKHE